MSKLAEKFQLEINSHRRVLNEIRINAEISAANIARALKLQPSTLVYILRSLHEKNLVEVSRIGQQEGSAGKPPTLWRLVSDAGYILGVEVIQHEMRLIIIDFSCTIVHKAIKSTSKVLPDEVAPIIAAFILAELRKAQIDVEKVIGAGIALTGLVERETGIIRYSRKLELYDFDLQKALVPYLYFPVEIVNDANAGALGIKWHLDGAGTREPNVVFLTLNEKNSDMGAGLILHNHLYEGAYGTAGEIFTMLPDLHDLLYQAQQQHPQADIFKQPNVQLCEVITAAEKGCTICLEILNIYSEKIKDEILRIVEFINPNVIVIGGDISDAKNVIAEYIRQSVRTELENIFPVGVPAPQILFSDMGIYAVSLGATALVLRKIFTID